MASDVDARLSSIGEEPSDSSAPSAVEICADDYAVGRVFSGKYRVDRIIGEGAMGIVLAATHLELDETVAIKFIRPEMQKVPGVLSRFAREAKALAKIKSEHVPIVLDIGTATPIGPYIVMEYLEGEDLACVLLEQGYLSVGRAVEYVMQACDALAAAHGRGITHRDIKPENLFLTRRGDHDLIKVLDFGISKANLSGRVFGDDLSLLRTSVLMGTPLYMSPEQIRAEEEVDLRADIWSLGVVLYELLTGRLAFHGDSVTQICARVLESMPPELSELLPTDGVPAGLQAVLDRALAKRPSERYQNSAEFAFALLPFAPSRALLYAERAESVLRCSDAGRVSQSAADTVRLPAIKTMLATGASRFRSEADLLESPHSTAPVVADRASSGSLQRSRSPSNRLRAAAAAALLVLGGLAFSRFRGEDAPPPAARVQAAPGFEGRPAAAVVRTTLSRLSSSTPAASADESDLDTPQVASSTPLARTPPLAKARATPWVSRRPALQSSSELQRVDASTSSTAAARTPEGPIQAMTPKARARLLDDRPRVKLLE